MTATISQAIGSAVRIAHHTHDYHPQLPHDTLMLPCAVVSRPLSAAASGMPTANADRCVPVDYARELLLELLNLAYPCYGKLNYRLSPHRSTYHQPGTGTPWRRRHRALPAAATTQLPLVETAAPAGGTRASASESGASDRSPSLWLGDPDLPRRHRPGAQCHRPHRPPRVPREQIR